MAFALVGSLILSRVDPFVYQRLYEALGLSVDLRPVGSGEKMAKFEPLADLPEYFRSIASPIVGHKLIDGNAQFLEVLGRPLKEGRCGFTLVVLQYLDIRQSRVVVDTDMRPFPSGASAVHYAIACDSMVRLVKFGQFLDVEVSQVVWYSAFVATHRLLGVVMLGLAHVWWRFSTAATLERASWSFLAM